MPIETRCASCKTTYRLADSSAGKKLRCKKCNNVFRVPEAEPLDEIEETEVEPAPVKKASKKSARDSDDAPRPKKKSKASAGGMPNDMRRALALLIFVGVLQGVAFYLLTRVPGELMDAGKYLTPAGEKLLLASKAVAGGIALLAFGAAVLLFLRKGIGRRLAFVVAIILLLSVVLIVGLMMIQNQWASALNWITAVMNLTLGLAILFFADTKNVRAYLASGTEAACADAEEEEEPDDEDDATRRKKRK